MEFLLDRAVRAAKFGRNDISPFFWINDRIPTSNEWKALAACEFKDCRLKGYGEVENPVELSLDELLALGKQPQITLHLCIQGWSGIAAWIQAIEFVQEIKSIYKGEGGYAEDHEYFSELTNI